MQCKGVIEMCFDFYKCWLYKDGELVKKRECLSVAEAAEIIASIEGLRKRRIYKHVLRAFHKCEPYKGYMIDIFPPAGSYGSFSKTLKRKQAAALIEANKACLDARRHAKKR